jgi:hypothetical protein
MSSEPPRTPLFRMFRFVDESSSESSSEVESLVSEHERHPTLQSLIDGTEMILGSFFGKYASGYAPSPTDVHINHMVSELIVGEEVNCFVCFNLSKEVEGRDKVVDAHKTWCKIRSSSRSQKVLAPKLQFASKLHNLLMSRKFVHKSVCWFLCVEENVSVNSSFIFKVVSWAHEPALAGLIFTVPTRIVQELQTLQTSREERKKKKKNLRKQLKKNVAC